MLFRDNIDIQQDMKAHCSYTVFWSGVHEQALFVICWFPVKWRNVVFVLRCRIIGPEARHVHKNLILWIEKGDPKAARKCVKSCIFVTVSQILLKNFQCPNSIFARILHSVQDDKPVSLPQILHCACGSVQDDRKTQISSVMTGRRRSAVLWQEKADPQRYDRTPQINSAMTGR